MTSTSVNAEARLHVNLTAAQDRLALHLLAQVLVFLTSMVPHCLVLLPRWLLLPTLPRWTYPCIQLP